MGKQSTRPLAGEVRYSLNGSTLCAATIVVQVPDAWCTILQKHWFRAKVAKSYLL